MVKKMKANVAGVFALVGVGDEGVQNLKAENPFPVEVVATIQPFYQRSEIYI
jgi:adenine/guanine phosphoribosyltransferase-like PRPP-binding protein